MIGGNFVAPQQAIDRGRPITFTSEGRPLSCIYDDHWDLSGMCKVGVGKPSKLGFAGKTSHISPKYKRKIQETIADMIDFDLTKGKAFSFSRTYKWKNALSKIADDLGSENWAEIDNEVNWKSFKKKLEKRQLRKQQIESAVQVLDTLSLMGVVRRHETGSELYKYAKDGVTKQHIAIPARMYRQVLSSAISDLESYHEHRHEIARVMQEAYEIQDRVKAGERLAEGRVAKPRVPLLSMDEKEVGRRVTRNIRRLVKHGIPNFKITLKGDELNRILTSCLIVIEGFSGVRVGECLSFNLKSYEEKLTEAGKIIAALLGETTKSNEGVPKRGVWQTHPIVKDALELAHVITEPLRKKYKDQIEERLKGGEYNKDQYYHAKREVESVFLAATHGKQESAYVMTSTAYQIKSQMKRWNIVATEEDVEEFDLLNPSWEGELEVGGELPKLTNHDLRRSFAVFYKRHGFGSDSGIKFQYKHRNINMSGYYAANAELAAMKDLLLDQDLLLIMKQEGINLGVDIYDDIYNKSEHLSGGGGQSIAQDKFERARAGHDVLMTRSEIEVLVKNGTLSVVQLPTGGYCTNRDCERLCDFGMFTVGKSDCNHKVITDKEAKKKQQQRLRAIETFRGLNKGDSLRNSMLVGIKRKIKDIEITLDTHEIEYEPFNDEIEGIIYAKQA